MHENPERSIGLLTKIATHLRSGNLAHPKFRFDVISVFNDMHSPPTVPHCGTAGCAMGEFPILFPETFCFGRQFRPDAPGICLVGKDPYTSTNGLEILYDVADFLGLSYEEVQHLFLPLTQRCFKYGGESLSDYATPYAVASNIDDFIEVVLKPLLKA